MSFENYHTICDGLNLWHLWTEELLSKMIWTCQW